MTTTLDLLSLRCKKLDGELPEPGLHEGISSDDYHRIPALNASLLKTPGLDPLDRCWERVLAVMNEEAEPPRYWAYDGSARHAAVLEPDRANEQIVEVDFKIKNPATNRDVTFNRNQDGAILQLFAEHDELAGMLPVVEGDRETILAMAAKARAHPRVGDLLKVASKREVVIIWHEEAFGLPCKARFDWLIEGTETRKPVIVDYKTAESVAKHTFDGQIVKLGYAFSALWYMRGYEALFGETPAFRIIAQEKKPPYPVRVWSIEERLAIVEAVRTAEMMARFARCLSENHWPGYPDRDEECDLPAWLESLYVDINGNLKEPQA